MERRKSWQNVALFDGFIGKYSAPKGERSLVGGLVGVLIAIYPIAIAGSTFSSGDIYRGSALGSVVWRSFYLFAFLMSLSLVLALHVNDEPCLSDGASEKEYGFGQVVAMVLLGATLVESGEAVEGKVNAKPSQNQLAIIRKHTIAGRRRQNPSKGTLRTDRLRQMQVLDMTTTPLAGLILTTMPLQMLAMS
jgi:hypothetical protein